MTRALRPTERAARQVASGVPACWTWPLPAVAVTADAWRLMCEWADDRCGICGLRTSRLVQDHDHKSGLTRGHLCMQCNVQEGCAADEAIFIRYRRINPASICGLELLYEIPLPPAGILTP